MIDGDITEIKAKNIDELFLSTTNGNIYFYTHNERVRKHKNQTHGTIKLFENFDVQFLF